MPHSGDMLFRRVLLLGALVLAGLAAGWAAAADRDQHSEPDLGPVVVIREADPPPAGVTPPPAGGATPVQPHAPAQAGEDADSTDGVDDSDEDDPDDGDG